VRSYKVFKATQTSYNIATCLKILYWLGMANPSTARVKNPGDMHDLHHHQDRRRHLDVFKKKNFVPRGKSMLMNGWAHQRIRQPSAVFGTLLLQAGSHAGALPWHLAHTPLSQTCVARPQEAPVCSPQALHAWLAVAVATHFERQETNHSTCNHAFSHQPSSFTNMILPLEQNPKFLTNQSTPTKAQDLLQCKR